MADGSRRLTVYSETESRVNELIRRYHDNPEGPMFSESNLAEVPFDTRLGMVLDALEGEIDCLQQREQQTGGMDPQVQEIINSDPVDGLGR